MRGFILSIFVILHVVGGNADSCSKSTELSFESRLKRLGNLDEFKIPNEKFFEHSTNYRPLLRSLVNKLKLQYEYEFKFSNGKKGRKQSVFTHTLRTMHRLDHQISSGDSLIRELNLKKYRRAMFVALMIHDVAKRYAYESGDNRNQLGMNYDFASGLLAKFQNLRLEEVVFVKAILSSAMLGAYLQNQVSGTRLLKANMAGAKYTELSAAQYLRFMETFYLSDAGSYSHLATNLNIMEQTRHGGLRVSAEKWRNFLSSYPEPLF